MPWGLAEPRRHDDREQPRDEHTAVREKEYFALRDFAKAKVQLMSSNCYKKVRVSRHYLHSPSEGDIVPIPMCSRKDNWTLTHQVGYSDILSFRSFPNSSESAHRTPQI